MVELNQNDIDAIHATHDKVIRIDTIIGNGDKGLCYDVRCQQKRINRIELFLVFLIGSGMIGGGVISLLGLIKG